MFQVLVISKSELHNLNNMSKNCIHDPCIILLSMQMGLSLSTALYITTHPNRLTKAHLSFLSLSHTG